VITPGLIVVILGLIVIVPGLIMVTVETFNTQEPFLLSYAVAYISFNDTRRSLDDLDQTGAPLVSRRSEPQDRLLLESYEAKHQYIIVYCLPLIKVQSETKRYIFSVL